MLKKKLKVCVLIQAAALSLFCINSAAVPFDAGNIEPDFITIKSGPSVGGITEVKYFDEAGNEVTFDLVPSIQMAGETLPESYNLYDTGRATVIKNQGQEGLCWAFAGMSAVESNLITQGLENNNVDLSEKYMAWFNNGALPSDINDPLYGDGNSPIGTDAYDMGGNMLEVAYLLARGSGPVYESVVPQSTLTALPESLRYSSLYGLTEMQEFSPSDLISIKNAVYKNGAAYINYYCDNYKYLNHSTYGYYCPDDISTNHAVSIVGWDDNFSKDNFKTAFNTAPEGDGAWIIKNSWGNDWGDDGFFYLSYYDKSIGMAGSFIMNDKSGYDKIYQYDGDYDGAYSFKTAGYGISGANIFTAETNETLKSVGFWTRQADLSYKIKVYTDIPEGGYPNDGTLVYSSSGNMPYAGFHKLDLTTEIKLDVGSRYSVVIDLPVVGSSMSVDSYASGTEVSYLSPIIPSGYSWDDIGSELSCNVCIKAYTESDQAKIERYIELINALLDKGVDLKLTDEQLSIIEYILDYDYNK